MPSRRRRVSSTCGSPERSRNAGRNSEALRIRLDDLCGDQAPHTSQIRNALDSCRDIVHSVAKEKLAAVAAMAGNGAGWLAPASVASFDDLDRPALEDPDRGLNGTALHPLDGYVTADRPVQRHSLARACADHPPGDRGVFPEDRAAFPDCLYDRTGRPVGTDALAQVTRRVDPRSGGEGAFLSPCGDPAAVAESLISSV